MLRRLAAAARGRAGRAAPSPVASRQPLRTSDPYFALLQDKLLPFEQLWLRAGFSSVCYENALFSLRFLTIAIEMGSFKFLFRVVQMVFLTLVAFYCNNMVKQANCEKIPIGK